MLQSNSLLNLAVELLLRTLGVLHIYSDLPSRSPSASRPTGGASPPERGGVERGGSRPLYKGHPHPNPSLPPPPRRDTVRTTSLKKKTLHSAYGRPEPKCAFRLCCFNWKPGVSCDPSDGTRVRLQSTEMTRAGDPSHQQARVEPSSPLPK